MKRLYSVVLLLIIVVYPLTGFAQEDSSNVLGAFIIPKMIESEEEGLFIDLAREIEKRIGHPFTIKLRSPKRTIKDFEDGLLLGFFPGTETRMQQMENAVTSIAFYVKRSLIFTRKGVYLSSIEALEGKKVGLTAGYTYPETLTSNPHISFIPSESDVINMKNLAIGRLDAFIVEEFSGLSAMEECGCAADISYDLTAAISSQKVHFAFQATKQGRALAEEFSKALREMKKDGSLQHILGVSREWIEALPE